MNLPQVAAAVLDDQQRGSAVTCPMCHTPTSLTQSDIDAGEGWRCARCGQRWSATRLSTVAAYAASIAERAAVVGATGGKTVRPRIVAPELRSGKP
jgi:transposase-like protein